MSTQSAQVRFGAEIVVKHTFLDVEEPISPLAGEQGFQRKRAFTDTAVTYGTHDDDVASLETASMLSESDDATSESDGFSTSSESMPATVTSESQHFQTHIAAVPIFQCIPIPVFQVVSAPSQQQQPAKAVEWDRQAMQLKAQAEQVERAAQMMRDQAHAFHRPAPPCSVPSFSGYGSAASQLKVQAQEAEQAASLLRSIAKSQRSSSMHANDLDDQAMLFRREASDIEQAASLLRSKAKGIAITPQETAGATSQQSHDTQEGNEEHTTLMLRNIPNGYSRDMLLELLNHAVLLGTYDLVYVPWDFNRLAGLGYAFVNFTSFHHAANAKQRLQGFSEWTVASQKVCEVAYGGPLQGLSAHIEHYRNSPVMHKAVPECYKPALFKNGERQPFPEPTKSVRAPRMRRGGIPSL